ncbi:MAG: hypothetical protein IJ523_06720 [Succinivibrionaceae bacterium]|nr:hypothetical protein [Succinivibrionaceae bacterium]
MTLGDIRTLLVSVDPGIRHYFSTETDRDYTYWEELQRLPFVADGCHEEGWRFYVHRFTRDEFDPVARRLFETLDADPRTAVIHRVDAERETGYIHHIFECEGF